MLRAVLLDLDGVLYVGDAAVPGAAETVDWLVREGIPHRFLTNTTSRPREAIARKLEGLGIAATAEQILTPAVAAVAWMRRHRVAHPALFVPRATASEFADVDPLPATGIDPGAAPAEAGAVVVGDLGDGWDFATLNGAFRTLMAEARPPLIALGTTRYWRAPDGLRLDAGAFVRALEYATGREAVVLGKPAAAFFETAVADLAPEAAPSGGVPVAGGVAMVGDDIVTDVGGAQRAGLVGVLVRTGKFSPSDLAGAVSPDAVLDSIADLPRWWVGT